MPEYPTALSFYRWNHYNSYLPLIAVKRLLSSLLPSILCVFGLLIDACPLVYSLLACLPLACSNRSVGFAALFHSYSILVWSAALLSCLCLSFICLTCLPVSCLPLQVPPTNVGWLLSCLDHAWISAKGKPRA